MDRLGIFNRVVTLLKNETKFFTSSELHTWIGVDSFREIAERVHYPKSNYSCPLASGVWTVSVSSDFLKIDETKDLTFKDSTMIHKITHKNQKKIGRDQILSATPSTPANYFMENESTIGVYPPSTSGTLVIPYVKEPTSLSSDTDTNQLTKKCYMASVYWTMAQCMLKDSDSKFQFYMGLYDKETQKLESSYDGMFEEESSVSPNSNYLR